MRKHLFTLRRVPDDHDPTRCSVEYECYFMCEWPIQSVPFDADGEDIAKAYLVMIGGPDNLPGPVKDFCHAATALKLRSRYSPETDGPFLITDMDDSLTKEDVLLYFSHLSPARWRDYSLSAGKNYFTSVTQR